MPGRSDIGPVILDASAVLALLFDEPGAVAVADVLADARISAANMSEVLATLIDRGEAPEAARAVFDVLALTVAPIDAPVAATAAALRTPTRSKGLGLGDRLCLALAIESRLPVLTADRAWSEAGTGADVRLIR
jgi:ribonuclease VapC